MLQVERFFRQCRMLLRHCCRFWQQCCRFRQQCRTKFRTFDKFETNWSWTCSICFDFIERTKFYNRIVGHCCRLWQQSGMLLRQSRTLLRHCCWRGRGLTAEIVYDRTKRQLIRSRFAPGECGVFVRANRRRFDGVLVAVLSTGCVGDATDLSTPLIRPAAAMPSI